MDEASRFGREAGEIDQLGIGFGDFAQQGLEVGIADGDRVGRDDFAAQRFKEFAEINGKAFGIGATVVDGGHAPHAEGIVDVIGGMFAFDVIGRDDAVEAGRAAAREHGGSAAGGDEGIAGGVVDVGCRQAGGGAHRADDADDGGIGAEAIGHSDATFGVALRILNVQADGEFDAFDGDGGVFIQSQLYAALDIDAQRSDALAGEADGNADHNVLIRVDDERLFLSDGRERAEDEAER